MNALELTLIRLAFLAVLWLFVIAAVGVVRTDLFGPSSRRKQARKARQRRPAPAAKPARPGKTPRPGRGTPRELLVTAGVAAGTSLALDSQQITIGRADDATLVLNDDYASTRHARIFPQDGQWLVEDLGSTNGTLVNGRKLDGAVPLRRGDRVQVGRSVLELQR